MIIPKTCKLELCASDKDNRAVLNEPYLDITTSPAGERTGQLVSVNGRVLAVVPVQVDEHDVPGHVSEEVLKTGRKLAGRDGMVSVTCNGNATFSDGRTMPRHGVAPAPGPGNAYPNWRQVLPEKLDGPSAGATPTHAIVTIDISLLWKLAQALGTDALRLQIPVDGIGPIRADAAPGKGEPIGGYGAVMPMRAS